MKNEKMRKLLPRVGLVLLAGCLFLMACTNPGIPSPALPDWMLGSPVAETLVVNTAVPTPFNLIVTPGPVLNHHGDAIGAVMDALQKLQQSGPFHLKSVTSTAGGPISIDADIILPDHFHIFMGGTELLIAESQDYVRQDGAWVKDPAQVGNIASDLTANFSDQAIQAVTDAALDGTQILGSTPTHVYSYQTTIALEGSPVATQNRIWVSDSSGLPLHQEISALMDGVPSQTAQDYTYDLSIPDQMPTP